MFQNRYNNPEIMFDRRALIHGALVVEKKWKQPYQGEPSASNEDFDEDWKRRFHAYGVRD